MQWPWPENSAYNTLAGVVHIMSPPCSMKYGALEIFHSIEMDLSHCQSHVFKYCDRIRETHISRA